MNAPEFEQPRARPKPITFNPVRKHHTYIITDEDRARLKNQLEEYLKKNNVKKLPTKTCTGSKLKMSEAETIQV